MDVFHRKPLPCSFESSLVIFKETVSAVASSASLHQTTSARALWSIPYVSDWRGKTEKNSGIRFLRMFWAQLNCLLISLMGTVQCWKTQRHLAHRDSWLILRESAEGRRLRHKLWLTLIFNVAYTIKSSLIDQTRVSKWFFFGTLQFAEMFWFKFYVDESSYYGETAGFLHNCLL